MPGILSIEAARHVVNGINQEGRTMLGVKPDSLVELSQAGLLEVVCRGDRIVSTAGFYPLLHIGDGVNGISADWTAEQARVENVNLWELGKVWVDPNYRGEHLSTQVLFNLFDRLGEYLIQNNVHILGTTKSGAVLSALKHLSPIFNFRVSNHLTYPYIAPLTCVCSGDLGSGFNADLPITEREYCGNRSDLEIGGDYTLDEGIQFLQGTTGPKCVMFHLENPRLESLEHVLASSNLGRLNSIYLYE